MSNTAKSKNSVFNFETQNLEKINSPKNSNV